MRRAQNTAWKKWKKVGQAEDQKPLKRFTKIMVVARNSIIARSSYRIPGGTDMAPIRKPWSPSAARTNAVDSIRTRYRDAESMNTFPDKKSLIHSLPETSVSPLVIENRASPNWPLM